ncbi:endonuclease/exonuclease/phosphatase family protein [Niveomyces insectorum RCEF 264]|uniref:Endonuclease/exonuclease/phosphatase family protein n=1 Tax=Niveomyces insectorum RCEF 264 TaxID=1081102 RepID=A0A167MNK1_9HYPO|nr:endonuclease/exonuclease/phosphatase family protein [Niveomyces insectorum RCEF 264]
MRSLLTLLALGASVQAQTIPAINGKKFLSPYNGQAVTNVTGIVTAKSASGLYLRGPERSCDARTGNGLYVFSSTLGTNATIAVGDTLVLSGKVAEYRSSPDYLFSTELESPVIDGWVSGQGRPAPQPRVIGTDTLNPPTEQFSGLDNGDVFGVPNNVNQVSVANPTLQPDTYGLDFWKTLNGELVTLPSPVAVSKPNSYGETWMVGSWPTTGANGRGGLTLSAKDGNPETIIVGAPLDGSKANTAAYKIGDTFQNITGVVHYQFGFYYLLPLTAPTYIASATPALPPPTTLRSTGTCAGLTVGDYNVENFAPADTQHVQDVAAHIVHYMHTPDVLFVQEIQDNDGATNDGVVDGSQTLAALVDGIASLGGLRYSYVEINPANDADGGEPGGNIRQAYLYNPATVRLVDGAPAGGANDATSVVKNADGQPTLTYNPGRVDPGNTAAWAGSRKPLAAAWQTVQGGHVFFTVNVHWESKGGSSSLFGDPRPPVNRPVDKRVLQANVTAAFVAQILAIDADARIVVAGDFNEYAVVAPLTTFSAVSTLVDLDVAAGIPVSERYTYTFANDMEELDHVYVSPAIARLSPKEEHIHVNTWVSYADQVSDHDPTVALLNVCGIHTAPNTTSSSSSSSSAPSATSSSSVASLSSTFSTVTTSSASSAGASSSTTASSTAPSPSSSIAPALSGKGHFAVVSPDVVGSSNGGDLITAGTWYRGGGTPATYTATPNADGKSFRLKTSKGPCAILDSSDAPLSCASTVTAPSDFGFDGTYLTYAGVNTFYATAVPTGTTQGTIYASKQAVTMQIIWSPLS